MLNLYSARGFALTIGVYCIYLSNFSASALISSADIAM